MNKRKEKILINKSKNASSKNVDTFLNVDLFSTFYEIKKSVHENNFDLNEHFDRERNASRNFRIYGEISSNITDCNSLQCFAFKDSGYTNLLFGFLTTDISYNQNNVFGKKKGKYLVELNNYDSDEIFFFIPSNNSTYNLQFWSQKLVFYDLDGNFVPYGTEDVDIDIFGNSLTIENDFPFFYNKHWIRNDYNIIEEKKAKFSWNLPVIKLDEKSFSSVTLSLDKPSPFGLEKLTLGWGINSSQYSGSTSPFQQSSYGQLSFVDNTNNTIGLVNVDSSQTIFPFNGNIFVIINETLQNSVLLSPGRTFSILNGDYAGSYRIFYSTQQTNTPDENEQFTYFIILEKQYNGPSYTSLNYMIGSPPDVFISHNGQEIQLPYNLQWSQNEQAKNFTISASTDFDVELKEVFNIFPYNLEFLEKGLNPELKIEIADKTPKNQITYNFGNVYETRFSFTGRTVYDSNEVFAGTIDSPAILRSGLFYEKRNEEFYNNDFYRLYVKNEGERTIIPKNTSIGILQPTIFESLEEKFFDIKTKYNTNFLHKIELKYKSDIILPGTYPDSADGYVYVNGFKIPSITNDLRFFNFLPRINDSSNDWYRINNVPKPFTISINIANKTIVLTSTSPGTKLIVTSENPDLTITELNQWQEPVQSPLAIDLYANSNSNQIGRYSFRMTKQAFADIQIPANDIIAIPTATTVFLKTAYTNMAAPYYSDIDSGISEKVSTEDNVDYTSNYILNFQPTVLPKENVYINGFLFLAKNLAEGTRKVVTTHGIEDVNGNVFYGGFYSNQLSIIPITGQEILTSPTKAVWEIEIPKMPSLDQLGTTWNQSRSFDIIYGDINGNYLFYKVGGEFTNLYQDGGYWFNNFRPVFDQNDVQYPSARLYERLDTGNAGSNIPPGPFKTDVVRTDVIRIQSKVFSTPTVVENVKNYFLTPDKQDIVVYEIMKGLQAGQINPANNRLGGFSLNFN